MSEPAYREVPGGDPPEYEPDDWQDAAAEWDGGYWPWGDDDD